MCSYLFKQSVNLRVKKRGDHISTYGWFALTRMSGGIKNIKIGCND